MSMVLVSTVTVGAAGAASIEFTSIPQTGTDLLITWSTRSTNNDDFVNVTFNGSSASFTERTLGANGASVFSETKTNFAGFKPVSGTTANTHGNASMYIPNYAGSTNKSFSIDTVTEDNAAVAWQFIIAGLWSSTSAITSVALTVPTGLFAQYSTASLYTITKGSGGATVS